MLKIVLVFIGSGTGGALRVLVGSLVHSIIPSRFPLGTLVVNVSGCLAIGVLSVVLAGPMIRDEHRAILIVGLLGGYTTFSTFGRETLSLLQRGQVSTALTYIVLSNACAMTAVWLGWFIGACVSPAASSDLQL